MAEEQTWNAIWSFGVIAAGVAILLNLLFRWNQGGISDRYFIVFTVLLVIGLIYSIAAAIIDYSFKDEGILGTAFFLFEEESEIRPSLNIPLLWKFVIAGFFGIVLFAVVLGTGFQLYTIPNAYTWGVEVTASTYGTTADQIFLGAVVPAFAEELAMFASIQLLTALGMFSLKKVFSDVEENRAVYWMLVLANTALVVWIHAVQFSEAHAAYAGNEQAQAYLIGFSFLMQFMNVLLGGFFSWIPHFANNAGVLLKVGLAFSLFAAFMFVKVRPLVLKRYLHE